MTTIDQIRTTIITGLVGVSILAGCGKKDGSDTTTSRVPPPQANQQQPAKLKAPPAPAAENQAPAPAMPAPASQRQDDINYPDSSQIESDFKNMPPEKQAEVVARFWAFLMGAYRRETGAYPGNDEGLHAPIAIEDAPDKEQLRQFLVDPWGNEYVYEKLDDAEEPFTIYSLGPDGQKSDDDIVCQEVGVVEQAVRGLENQPAGE